MSRRKSSGLASLRVDWTDRALVDLVVIADYISTADPDSAKRWVTRLFEAGLQAGQFPLAGRKVPERGRDDLREVIVKRYRIIYRVREDSIRVLTVFDSRKRLPKDLELDS